MAGGEVKADGKFSGGNEAAGGARIWGGGDDSGWCLGQMDGATEELGIFTFWKHSNRYTNQKSKESSIRGEDDTYIIFV